MIHWFSFPFSLVVGNVYQLILKTIYLYKWQSFLSDCSCRVSFISISTIGSFNNYRKELFATFGAYKRPWPGLTYILDPGVYLWKFDILQPWAKRLVVPLEHVSRQNGIINSGMNKTFRKKVIILPMSYFFNVSIITNFLK